MTTLPMFTPVGIAWAPDGRMFIWQKHGVVRVFKNGVLLPTPFINLSAKVNTVDDRGMLGFAFHPDFANNGFIYLSYVFEEGGNPNDNNAKTSRLVRVTADPANPDVALANSEVVLLGSIGTPPCSLYPVGADCIAADGLSHTIGMIRFAPDGTMMLGNGDGSNGDFLSLRSQDLDNYSGKVLRLSDDGSAPGDNPFDDGTNSIRSRVWAYGARNPFRFVFHPTNPQLLYLGEIGWETWEEVNRGGPGTNFGWPCYEGPFVQPFFAPFAVCQQLPPASVTQPIFYYDRSVGTASIGGSFYTGTLYPEVYRGSYFFADYTGDWIRRIVFDANGDPVSFPYFATSADAPVGIEQGPDGNLYYVSITTGQIRRIRFNGPSATISASPSAGLSPLIVSFSSAGSVDPGGGALTYAWNFGDGGTSNAVNPTHTYNTGSVTTYTASLTVTTTSNDTSTATTQITVGSRPPVATILTPADNTPFNPGELVAYQGTATDPEDGDLAASAFEWTVLLHHNAHLHTYVGSSGATSGSFVAADHGIGSYSYEVFLTVTDSSGLTGSASVLLPITPDTTPPTAPADLTASASGTSQINLSWTASTDNGSVTGYRIERCEGSGCNNFAQILAVGGTSYSDTGLAASTPYSYRVRATDAGGNFGAYSNVASATTATAPPIDTTPPSATADLSATPITSGQISLGWTAATDDVAVTGYRVERCQGAGCSGFAEIAAPTVTNYSDTGLAGSTSYSYRVRAADAAGNLGAYSAVASATTQVAPPTNGQAAAWGFNEGIGTSVADASGNGNLGAITGATWTTLGKFGGALSFDGVNDLVVVNASPSINVSSAMTLEAWIYPTAAQDGWRTILQREVNAYLLNASHDGGPLFPSGGGTLGGSLSYVGAAAANPINAWTHVALTYNGSLLQLYVNGLPVASLPASGPIETNTSALRIGGNAPFGEYFTGLIDEVRIYDRALSTVEIQTDMNTPVAPPEPDTTAPTAPAGLAATPVSGSRIDLTWSAATDAVGVTGYRVERCEGAACSSFAEIATPLTLSFSDLSLSALTDYSYRVRATDAAGNLGPYSNIASTATLAPADTTPPTAPTALDALAISSSQIDLSWTAATDAVGVTGYSVERCQDVGCSSFAEIATPVTTSFSDMSLAPATAYSYRVRASDAAGNQSLYSNLVSRSTDAGPDLIPPTAPTGASATAVSSTRIDLGWTAATDAVGVAGYRVERCQDAGCSAFAEISAPTATSYSDTGLALATSYSYRMRAADAAGNLGPYSTVASATTVAPPTNGQAAAWGFNEGIGTSVADASGNGNLGAITGATWTTLGKFGGALSFDGVNDLVVVNASPSINVSSAMTLEAWIYPTAAQSGWRTILQREVNAYLLNASHDGGPLFPSGGGTLDGSFTIAGAAAASPINAWTHVAVTYNGSLLQLYVNGLPVASTPATGPIETNTSALRIGGNVPFGEFFTGLIDEVRIYDRALSGVEIQTDMFTPVAPPDTTPPTDPTALGATAISTSQIDLLWTASTDAIGVTGYSVERCDGAACSSFAEIATSLAPSFSDLSLAASTDYSYRVRATDAAGNLSGYSNVASTSTLTPPDLTPPTDPTDLGATAISSSQIDLLWTASTDAIGVTGYSVERCEGAACSSFAEIATSLAPSFSDLSLAASTDYSYRVRATDAASNPSGYSNLASTTTLAPPDTDGDGVPNTTDNCPLLANADQTNTDADLLGDACDACPADADNDVDGDSICGDVDNCPFTVNTDQANLDADTVGDACDDDLDGDGRLNTSDNCVFTSNPTQSDLGSVLGEPADGVGDACQCGDVDDNGIVDFSDVDAYRDSLADPVQLALTPEGVAKCSVIDSADPCELLDVTVIQRALQDPPLLPGIEQVCTAATGP